MMAVVVTVFVGSNAAAIVGQHARHVLELNGGVMDAETGKNFVNALENAFAG